MKDTSCKTSRWMKIKSELHNLSAEAFFLKFSGDISATILDVRTLNEYTVGHIPGAVHIDYLSDQLWQLLDRLPRDNAYFVCCRSGRRSIRVCSLMKNGGFNPDKIFNLSHGLENWLKHYPDRWVSC